ncbi:hypothetical protein MLD38_020479 [Melastoma candidum]|uniref:Uncharacterized protein n=1 Tax=Melastoma candidum TaxID=119954 RepID=A0ACB9QCI4_9MYRT|nr:hypothetical protein MLD38_020479 [Melastoma candidum]
MQTTALPTPPLSAPAPGSTLPKTHLLNERLRSAPPWEALRLFDDLTSRGARWNKFTFPPMLRAAWKTKAIEEGMMYHGLLMKMGFSRDVFIETGLVRMYVGCGRVSEGRLVFDRMGRRRDVVAWNAMIDGCCQSGHFEEGIRLFEEMQSCNVKPDEMLLSTVLSACGRAGNLSYGKMIHEYIMENGITIDSHLQTALISIE